MSYLYAAHYYPEAGAAPPSAPTVVGGFANNPGTGSDSNITATLPAGIADGDVGLFLVTFNNESSVAADPTTQGGWTQVGSDLIAGTNIMTVTLFMKSSLAAADSSTAVTSVLSASARWACAGVVVRGASGTLDVSTSSAITGTADTALAYPSITPTAASDLLVVLGGLRYIAAATPGVTHDADWTERADTATTNVTNPMFGATVATRALSGGAGVAISGDTGSVVSNAREGWWGIGLAPAGEAEPTTHEATATLALTATLTAAATRETFATSAALAVTTALTAAATRATLATTTALPVTATLTATATRATFATTTALAVTTTATAEATRSTSVTTTALAVTTTITAAASKASVQTATTTPLEVVTTITASVARATPVAASLAVTTTVAATATRTATATTTALAVVTTITATATKASAVAVTASLAITATIAATADATTPADLGRIVLAGALMPVANRWVIIDGAKKPIAGMSVVVAGAKRPTE